jgi:hypothetical protein
MLNHALAQPGSPAFFAMFVGIWIAVCVTASLCSGWFSLARRFRRRGPASGAKFYFSSGSMGLPVVPASYSRVLFVSVGPAGLGLSVLFPFRLLHPPILIPWLAVESVVQRRLFFFESSVIRVHDQWPRIRLFGDAGRKALRQFEQYQREYAETGLPPG